MNQYEAMFLFDPTFGSSFEKCETEIQRLMERAGGEIIACRKWDERRLAYRIRGRKRGVYILVYFKAPPDKIAPLERDVKLAENVLRVLVLRAEHVTRDAMDRALGPPREEPAGTETGRRDRGTPAGKEAGRDTASATKATMPVATEPTPGEEPTEPAPTA